MQSGLVPRTLPKVLPGLQAASQGIAWSEGQGRETRTLHPIPSPPKDHRDRHRQSLEVEGDKAEAAQVQLYTTDFPQQQRVGWRGGWCKAGPSSSSSSSLALCATARQMGGPASSVAAAPSEPSFICQLITPCSVHLRIVSPHTDTCAPAFWQPRAGTVPAASPERQRAGPHGQRKAGWQVGGETVGVRSHKSSSEAFLFNTLFPFELSVKPLIN